MRGSEDRADPALQWADLCLGVYGARAAASSGKSEGHFVQSRARFT